MAKQAEPNEKDLDTLLRELVDVANSTQPGQVPHKIADIKSFVEDVEMRAYTRGKHGKQKDVTPAENAKKKVGIILAKSYGVKDLVDKISPEPDHFALQFAYSSATPECMQEMRSHIQQELPEWYVDVTGIAGPKTIIVVAWLK